MKELTFEVIVAEHYGMCFGVKAAIKKAQQLADRSPVTVLGELAHNTTVKQSMTRRGALHGGLEDSKATTKNVIITAHGASDKDRQQWSRRGHKVADTTCPLVHKAHHALALLVTQGYHPIVIGKANHVEVKGLTGDFPTAQVVESIEAVDTILPHMKKIGIISQTTQQITHVESVVEAIQHRFTSAEVKFIDTVCHPTKNRQKALIKLCSEVEVVIVVGGKNSNNTAQLVKKCHLLNCKAYHVQQPSDINPLWFKGAAKVGLTAGTSTPDSDISKVKKYLDSITSEQSNNCIDLA